ncbi:hypothetical protein CCY99_07215 [Helicobacter sp. 16-1353]|uniref:TolC family protein n=1 Tax=Helicobacter sp. 16-1353 TaxID=2004996 RepID=UPI000DCB01AC|nr:TolC family protein [Helicobacter sp. 16-1353]RAX52748.1 hypothetical protein CCY99_07215 [Helicobacter sp. 16-1353]
MLKIILISIVALLLNAYDLSLEESFNKVLLNNDGLKASQQNVQKARKLKSAANMMYMPNIDLIGSYTYISDPIQFNMQLPLSSIMPILPNINHTTNISTNNLAYGIISIMYPLYTGGKRLSAGNIADLNIDDANFLMQLKKINLFEDLVKTYYGLILNLEILQTLLDVENGHKIHLENAIALEQNGQIAKLERLSAQVAYDKSKSKTLQAKDSLSIALLGFETILQDSNIMRDVTINQNGTIENLHLISPLKISLKELDSLESYQQKVLASYPALKSIEIKQMQAEELSNIEFADFLPTIGLYGGYIFKDNNVLLNKMIPNWNVGIVAKISIFSQKGRIFRYQASQIAQNEINYMRSQAKKDILLLTQKTYKEVVFAKESYENLESTLELAKENLRLQEEAFRNGMGDSAKVIDARNALSGAMIEIKNVEYRYILALAKLCVLSNDIDLFYTFYK